MVDKRIADYLRGLQIKTASFGGFDKTATFETLKELSRRYEEILAENAQTQKDERAKIEQAILQAKEKLDTAHRETDAAQAAARKAQEDSQALQGTLNAAVREKSDMQTALLKAQEEIRSLQGELAAANGTKADLQAQRENMSLREELNATRNEKASAQAALLEAQREVQMLRGDLNAAKGVIVQHGETEYDVNALLKEAEQTLAEAKSRRAQTENEAYTRREELLNAARSEAQDLLASAKLEAAKERAAAADALTALKQKKETMRAEMRSMITRLDTLVDGEDVQQAVSQNINSIQ